MGESRISGKGVHMYKGLAVHFADSNEIIFKGYLKTEAGEGVLSEPLNPLWIRYWTQQKSGLPRKELNETAQVQRLAKWKSQ